MNRRYRLLIAAGPIIVVAIALTLIFVLNGKTYCSDLVTLTTPTNQQTEHISPGQHVASSPHGGYPTHWIPQLHSSDSLGLTATVTHWNSLALATQATRLQEPTNDGDRPRLVIDHDGGADDAMAIFMASLKDENFGGPKLTALTTTFGNVEESQAFINSQIILDVAGRSDVLLYRGSTEPFVKGIATDFFFGRDGLGDNGLQSYRPLRVQNVHAALGLVQMASRYREKLIVVAIGSLTNIALAIKLDPEFINKVGHLYIGGGNINDEAEFNIAMDPEAYHIVASHGQPDKLTLIPFTTIFAYQNITEDWRINKLGTLPTSIMKRQNMFERVSMANATSWCLLDPAAMGIALDEDDILVEAKYAKATVGTCGSERGVTRYDFKSANATARVVTEVKKEPYQDLLLKLFAKDSKRAPLNWKL